jgi:chemotaxis signal transduction protein
MGGSVVILPWGNERYAVPSDRVMQVVASPVVTPIPTAPPAVKGVFNLRGEIVPLLDMGRLLGLEPSPSLSWAFAAVVETPNGRAGLTVTEVPRVGQLGSQVGPTETPGTTGIHSVGGELAVLLDLDVLLTTARIETG